MATRERSSHTETTGNATTHFIYLSSGSTRKSSVTSTYVSSTHDEIMEDEPTPHFHTLSKHGAIINKPASRSVIDEKYSISPFENWCTSANWKDYGMWYSKHGFHDGVSYDTPTGIQVSQYHQNRALSLASTDAWARVNDSVVSFGEMIAESRETINLFTKVVPSVAKALFNYKTALIAFKKHYISLNSVKKAGKTVRLKKKLRSAKATADLRDAWLQLRYGVRPVMYDLAGAWELCNKALYPRYTARGYRLHEESDFSETYGGIWASMRSRNRVERKISLHFRTGILYSFRNHDYDWAASVGLNQLWTLPWELFPYSFVIDWFCNLGDWLNALAPSIGVNKLASWWKVSYDSEISATCTLEHNPSYYRSYPDHDCSGSGTFHRQSTAWERTPNLALPASPRWEVNLDFLKLADLVALLHGIRGSR